MFGVRLLEVATTCKIPIAFENDSTNDLLLVATSY